jgi:hypothetical protein
VLLRDEAAGAQRASGITGARWLRRRGLANPLDASERRRTCCARGTGVRSQHLPCYPDVPIQPRGSGMSSKVLYEYAVSASGSLVHISDVPDNREERGKYSCLGCDSAVIARRGKLKRPHYAHKPNDSCRPETYLHRLGKRVFIETYTRCLTNGEAYLLTLESLETCLHRRPSHAPCTFRKTVSFDLTQFFPIVELERQHAGFQADVLLSNRTNGEAILVEIAVTHRCEPRKLKSALRIIEFPVTTINDIEHLRAQGVRGDGFAELYNFNPRARSRDCEGACTKSAAEYLVVDHRGACDVAVFSDAERRKEETSGAAHVRHFERLASVGNLDGRFPAAIRQASAAGVRVVDCNVCQFVSRQGFYEIRCARRRARDHRKALTCGLYRSAGPE